MKNKAYHTAQNTIDRKMDTPSTKTLDMNLCIQGISLECL